MCAASCSGSLAACTSAAGAPFCTDLNFDPQNCGACGGACAADQVCIAGACSVCVPSTWQCIGDTLARCATTGGSWTPVQGCAAGLCDAPNAQCDVCVANASTCATTTARRVCAADGQSQATISCTSPAPYCAAGSCVECLTSAQCTATGQQCLVAVCASNQCAQAPVASGTACSVGGDPGTCDGAGACRVCVEGAARCAAGGGATPQTCVGGAWVSGSPCGGATPYCASGACVECTSSGQCPSTGQQCLAAVCASQQCATVPLGGSTSCSIGADVGTCDGSGSCRVCTEGAARCASGGGQVPQLCVSGAWVSQAPCSGATPNCSGGVCSGAACGNGITEPGEACDDSNTALCDGCESCEKRRWVNLPAGAAYRASTLDDILPGPTESACYEAWARTNGTVSDAIYASSVGSNTNINFILRCFQVGTRLQFAVQNGPTFIASQPLAACGDGQWHHVAGCREISGSNATLHLYWDGVLVGSETGSATLIGAPTDVVFGGTTYMSFGLGGAIDEFRISRGLRYAANFTPQRRLAVDASTVVLYHMDEGTGTTLGDSGGSVHSASVSAGTPSWSIDSGYAPGMCL
ncbi:MAG: hypothetical protein IT376_07730 [Polyangiaceae bacterium]|nr:hypothetical protein [Polyangiaceae bacterium]